MIDAEPVLIRGGLKLHLVFGATDERNRTHARYETSDGSGWCIYQITDEHIFIESNIAD